MKTRTAVNQPRRDGYALLLVIAFTGVALLLATGLFNFSSTSSNLNYRHIEHVRATAAAEAATEKVMAQVVADYRDMGEGYILSHLHNYRTMVPTSAEFPAAGEFLFQNQAGQNDRLDVTYLPGNEFTISSGRYSGLHGIKGQLRVVANARGKHSTYAPVGSVYQDIELMRIPVFQFAVFYNLIMEIDNGPNTFTLTGPVHCNTNIYLDPYNTLTFNSDITASGTLYEHKLAGNPMSSPGSGAIIYHGAHDSSVSTLNLPVGTDTSPDAIHRLIEIPPVGEDPKSSIGRLRYYNKADLIIGVNDTNIVATSGLRNGFSTIVPAAEIETFLSTNVTFYSKREQKWIQCTEIDITRLIAWNATNKYLRSIIPGEEIRTLFVADMRSQTSNTESGVRLVNGQRLLPKGLTVATPNPLYTLGHYNAPPVHLGTTNTSLTHPASLVADAVTILSVDWADADSDRSLSDRKAGNTTVNAAILTGQVPTSPASYSGGVQNFPRLLEEWNGRTLTYNGSMVAMFYSKIATNIWRGIGASYDIYNAPVRNWAFDQNFVVEAKLPPATPSFTVLVRGKWRMPAPYTTNVMAGF